MPLRLAVAALSNSAVVAHAGDPPGWTFVSLLVVDPKAAPEEEAQAGEDDQDDDQDEDAVRA